MRGKGSGEVKMFGSSLTQNTSKGIGQARERVVVCAHAQSCPTLWNPMDWSLPGSSVHGIFQARILECVAISFSRGSSCPRDRSPKSPALEADALPLHHLLEMLCKPWERMCSSLLFTGRKGQTITPTAEQGHFSL